jgi:hypothetical protein
MRAELIAYLTSNLKGTIKCASELPWAQGDVVLYRQNLKRVYLDAAETSQDILLTVLGGLDISRTVTTVKGYLAVDAKNKPSDLESVLVIINNAKDMASMDSTFRKEFDYTSQIDRDVIIYTFEYRYTEIN